MHINTQRVGQTQCYICVSALSVSVKVSVTSPDAVEKFSVLLSLEISLPATQTCCW